MTYLVKFDKKKCIGCGACTVQCDNWIMEDGKAHPKKTKLEKIGCNKDAEEVCPVDAIKIIEE